MARHLFSAELHYLYAVLLVGLDRDDEAAAEARRVLYLDRSLAVAHFLLGSVSLRRDDRGGACVAATGTPATSARRCRPGRSWPSPTASRRGRLAELARLQLERLDAVEGAAP